ncbi:hypothetical protein FD754_010839, partial [Muntiacus muntjak]
AIFLFEFKMGCKAAETAHNINNAYDPGTANKHTEQWWFRKFCKGEDSAEDKKHTDPLTTTREVAKELNTNHAMVVQCLKQIAKVKEIDKGVPRELTKKKNCLHNKNEPFLNRVVTTMKKWIVMVAVWWSAAGLIHYSFLNPTEITISEKYAQQTDEIKGPMLHDSARPDVAQSMLQKLKRASLVLQGLRFQTPNAVLPHPPYSPDLLPTDYQFFMHLDNFLQGKCFHNQQDSENAFQEFAKSQSTDFYTTGISKLISCWQKGIDCNDSYFD